MIVPSRVRALPIRPLAILTAMVALAIGSQVLLSLRPHPTPLSANGDALPPLPLPAIGEIDSGDGATTAVSDELTRIKADISFWAARYEKNHLDFVSATQWGVNEIALGRATG